MNSQSAILACPNPQPDSQPIPVPPQTLPTCAATQEPPTERDTSLSTWRHNGKIFRLPKSLRDKINLMLQDGVTYQHIIDSLGDAGKDLNAMNLSRWKETGFQEWVLEQSWLAQIRSRQEPATSLAANCDATEIIHAGLQLSTLQMFEALRDLGSSPALPTGAPLPDVVVPAIENQNSKIENRKSNHPSLLLDQRLGGDSAAFVRLMNALARASRETMLVQKYREACAKAKAALNPLRDPNRKLTESERRAIILEVDEILGLNGNGTEVGEPEPQPLPTRQQDPGTSGPQDQKLELGKENGSPDHQPTQPQFHGIIQYPQLNIPQPPNQNPTVQESNNPSIH